jgi:hypothetical protein
LVFEIVLWETLAVIGVRLTSFRARNDLRKIVKEKENTEFFLETIQCVNQDTHIFS